METKYLEEGQVCFFFCYPNWRLGEMELELLVENASFVRNKKEL